MPIRLKWKNINTGSSVVKIYRGVTPVDTGALPDPIVTISNGALSYLDEVPKYGESFYYLFSVTVNGRTLLSTNRLYRCMIDLGPGPQDLVMGDFKMGYFGTVACSDIGVRPETWTINPGYNFYTMHKIVRNGRIHYVSGTMVNSTVNQLAANKLLTSGVNAFKDPFAGSAGGIVEFNNRLYAPRVAKLFDEANADTNYANYGVNYGPNYPRTAANPITPTGKSELVDLIRMLKAPSIAMPTPFCLGSDANGSPLISCDFETATMMRSNSTYERFDAGATQVSFASVCWIYPVVEYKGIA